MRILITLAFLATASAQDLPFLRPTPSHVTVITKVASTSDHRPTSKSSGGGKSESDDRPTSTCILVADVTPKPNIHVYAPGAEGYQAVTLTVDPHPGVTPGTTRYPKPGLLVTGAEKVPVFSKTFQLALPVAIDRAVAGAPPIALVGKLQLQACDDQVCYKPETIPVKWEIRN